MNEASPSASSSKERLLEILDEADDLLAKMRVLTLESDVIKRQEIDSKKESLDITYHRAKLDIIHEELLAEKRLLPSPPPYDIESSPRLSPVPYQVTSPAFSEFSDLSRRDQAGKFSPYYASPNVSDITGVGSWSDIQSPSMENIERKVPQKPKRSKKAVIFSEKDCDEWQEVWCGNSSKKIFHDLRCKHYQEANSPVMATVAQALEMGYRLPKSVGGCCRRYFAPL